MQIRGVQKTRANLKKRILLFRGIGPKIILLFSAEQTVIKFKVSHRKRSLEAGLGLGLKGPGLKLKLAQNMTAS